MENSTLCTESSENKALEQIPNDTAVKIVDLIQEILWLDGDGNLDMEKEWSTDTLNDIARVFETFGYRPKRNRIIVRIAETL